MSVLQQCKEYRQAVFRQMRALLGVILNEQNVNVSTGQTSSDIEMECALFLESYEKPIVKRKSSQICETSQVSTKRRKSDR